MARIESYPPGSFCWAELATNNLQAAKKLYGELFGWSAADYPIPGGGVYTMFQIDGNDVAAGHASRPVRTPAATGQRRFCVTPAGVPCCARRAPRPTPM
jgi:predicted enzyme related to lactoylglutathione lyase